MGRWMSVAAVALGLGGCQLLGSVEETITFRYKYAVRTGQQDVYDIKVMRGALTQPCANQADDRMRLEQIAFLVQRFGIDSMINVCHDRFTLPVADIRAQGTGSVQFEFFALPNQPGERVTVNGIVAAGGNSFPSPVGITIQTNGPAPLSQKVTDGFAEIVFGGGGPTYRCEGRAGEEFWDQHIRDPLSDTFFEFTLTGRNPQTPSATAEFQCLARNRTDPNDQRLMLVMIGSIIMRSDN